MARKRYQKGTLVKQGIRDPKWFGQHREDVVDNSGNVRRVFRKVLLGTVRELPTRKLAQRDALTSSYLESMLRRIVPAAWPRSRNLSNNGSAMLW
jgi:hypothetical protein